MKRRIKRITSCILAVTAAAALLGLNGCETKEERADGGEKTLTYWVGLSSAASTTVSDYGDTPFSQELQKRTGVRVKYQHPPQGQESEKFNIMVAMAELPDIIEYKWGDYPGGPGKAISENKIVDLTPYIDERVPELNQYLEEHPNIAKLCKTDDKQIFGFPFIRGAGDLCVSQGLVLRKDWLDELNLEIPETIDDWEKVLLAFKNSKGAASPLDINPYPFQVGAFTGAYGVIDGFYVEDAAVKYGPIEPGFRDFLSKMNQWYQMGLFNQDIATLTNKMVDADLISGATGAVHGSIGGGIGKWMAAAKDDGFDLCGAPYPTLNQGETAQFNARQLDVPGTFTAISTSCKDIESAVKLLGYGYTEEGRMLYNFGIEGESYQMEDGYPKYTELITDNSEGLPMSAALARYTQSYSEGPFIQDPRYMEQYGALPQQQQAWKAWARADSEPHLMPYVYYDVDEASEVVKKTTAIQTYEAEMVLKFIMGIEPLENYDQFAAEMHKRGIDDVLRAKQDAYNRYLER